MPDSTYTVSSTDDVDDEVEDHSDHESEIPQFNLLPPPLEVATARLAAARLADAAAATTREETEHVLQEFLQDPNIVGLAVHSRAAPATLNKNKSQLNTSYSMLEAVLDSGKFPGGDVAQPQALRALKLFFVTRPTTYEERCSHLYKCYMTDYKLLCMVLCTLATGYRKANDGGKCSAESFRQRMSSLARILRGEHHVVQTAKNDMAPILVPDDLMDFNGRFALMWKVIDGHDKIAFKAGEPQSSLGAPTAGTSVPVAPPVATIPPATPASTLGWQAMAAANGTYTVSSTDDVDDEVEDHSDHESEIPQFNLLPPPLEVATARLAAARLADSPVGQPNNAVAVVAGTSATHRLGEEASEHAAAATTREETEHVLQEFLQDPNIVGLAVHSRAAPATLNKNKSQLNTSYSMLEAVLDSGKFPGGDVAQPQALRALKLFFVTRPTTYEERCSHLYKCYMTDYKLLCMVLCTLATGYRKANDGGKCSAESFRQRMSSLARILRGEHHVVQTAKNDMAPILVPDDLMDFNGRFALMWKVIDGHDKIAFKAGESHYPFILHPGKHPRLAGDGGSQWAAQRLHEFYAHEAAGKALKMKLLAAAAAI
ncbi:hypothetical protein V8C86DRAFT_3022462 [Haematococcus lacustris]